MYEQKHNIMYAADINVSSNYMSHPRLQMVETTATNEMPVLHKNNLRVATPLENHTEEHIFINTRLLRIVV